MFRHPSLPWVATAAAFVLGAHYASVLAQESGQDASQRPSYYYGHYDPDTVARAPKPVKKPAATPAPSPKIVRLPPSSLLPPTSPLPPVRQPSFPNQEAAPSRKPAHVSPDEQGPAALRRPSLITQPAAIKPSGVKDSAPLFPLPEAIKADSIAAQPAAPPVPNPSKTGSPRPTLVTTAPVQDRTAAPTIAGASRGLTALPKVNHAQPLADPALSPLLPKSMVSKYLPRESQAPVPPSAAQSSNANAQSRLVEAQPVDTKPVDASTVNQSSATPPQSLVPKATSIGAGVADSKPATPPIAGRFPSPVATPKVVKSEPADSGNAASIVSQQPQGLVVLPRSTKTAPGEDKIAALAPPPQGPPAHVVPEIAHPPAVSTTSQDSEPAENRVRALTPGSEPIIVVVEPAKRRSPMGVDAMAKQAPSPTATPGERTPAEKTLPEASAPQTVADSASLQRQPEVVAAPIKNAAPVIAPLQPSTASRSAPGNQDKNPAIAATKKPLSQGVASPAKVSQTSVGFVFPKLLKVAGSVQTERPANVAAVGPAKTQRNVAKTASNNSNSNRTSAPSEPSKVADSKPSKSQASPAAEMPVDPPPTIAETDKDERKLPLRPNPMRSRQTYLVSKYAASIAAAPAAPAAAPSQPKRAAARLASVPVKSERPLRNNPVREMDRLSDAGHVNPLR